MCGRSIGRETAEVAPGREHLFVRGGEDDDPDLLVGLGLRQRFEQFAEKLIGERVSRLGVVERDRRDMLDDLVSDLFVGSHK